MKSGEPITGSSSRFFRMSGRAIFEFLLLLQRIMARKGACGNVQA
jgi:hypothetical protein